MRGTSSCCTCFQGGRSELRGAIHWDLSGGLFPVAFALSFLLVLERLRFSSSLVIRTTSTSQGVRLLVRPEVFTVDCADTVLCQTTTSYVNDTTNPDMKSDVLFGQMFLTLTAVNHSPSSLVGYSVSLGVFLQFMMTVTSELADPSQASRRGCLRRSCYNMVVTTNLASENLLCHIYSVFQLRVFFSWLTLCVDTRRRSHQTSLQCFRSFETREHRSFFHGRFRWERNSVQRWSYLRPYRTIPKCR